MEYCAALCKYLVKIVQGQLVFGMVRTRVFNIIVGFDIQSFVDVIKEISD